MQGVLAEEWLLISFSLSFCRWHFHWALVRHCWDHLCTVLCNVFYVEFYGPASSPHLVCEQTHALWLRYVDLMWSLFLIRYLYFNFKWSDIMPRFVVKNGHQKNTCHNEIGLYARNIVIILGSIMNTIVESGGWLGAWGLCDCLRSTQAQYKGGCCPAVLYCKPTPRQAVILVQFWHQGKFSVTDTYCCFCDIKGSVELRFWGGSLSWNQAVFAP